MGMSDVGERVAHGSELRRGSEWRRGVSDVGERVA